MSTHIWTGLAIGIVTIPFLWWLVGVFSVDVREAHAVLITSFGKLVKTYTQTGHHWCFTKPLPWLEVHEVSVQLQSETYKHLSIHDRHGTSLLVDIWLQYQVIDPERLLFSVNDWSSAVRSSLVNGITSTFSDETFNEILSNRSALEADFRPELESDLLRWGISVKKIMILNITVLPELNRQILQGVAAHLERKKAVIDEEARVEAQKIHANTQLKTSALKAEAGVQNALSVSQAYKELKQNSQVFDSYEKLYGLSLYKSENLLVFEGFDKNAISTGDALLVAENFQQLTANNNRSVHTRSNEVEPI